MKQRFLVRITILICFSLIIFMPTVKGLDGTILSLKESFTLKNNNGESRVINIYNNDSNIIYQVDSLKLGPFDGGVNNFDCNNAGKLDTKQIAIIQSGKNRQYSDISIQIALYLEMASISEDVADQFFAKPLAMALSNQSPYGTNKYQLINTNDYVNQAFDLFFESNDYFIDEQKSGYTGVILNLSCENGKCYYPNKDNSINLAELTKLNIPEDANITAITTKGGINTKVNSNLGLYSKATFNLETSPTTDLCDDCAYVETTITYEHSSNVIAPVMCAPYGAGNVLNTSNMLLYRGKGLINKSFILSSGYSQNSNKSLPFHKFDVCGSNIISEGGVEFEDSKKSSANSFNDVVVDYSKIFAKNAKTCDNKSYKTNIADVGSYSVSVKSEIINKNDEPLSTTNRYCTIYCKEDFDIDIPSKVIAPTNSNGIVFSGRYFLLNDLRVTARKTCVTGINDNGVSIDLPKFLKEMYGYSWNENKTSVQNVSYGNNSGGGHKGTSAWVKDAKEDMSARLTEASSPSKETLICKVNKTAHGSHCPYEVVIGVRQRYDPVTKEYEEYPITATRYRDEDFPIKSTFVVGADLYEISQLNIDVPSDFSSNADSYRLWMIVNNMVSYNVTTGKGDILFYNNHNYAMHSVAGGGCSSYDYSDAYETSKEELESSGEGCERLWEGTAESVLRAPLKSNISSAESSETIIQRRTIGSVEDLNECFSFYKKVNYYTNPNVKFHYCDEYNVEYELKENVEYRKAKIEFCKKVPSLTNYDCPESETVYLTCDVDSDGNVSLCDQDELNRVKNELFREIQHYKCNDSNCSSWSLVSSNIPTNLSTKVEINRQYTANTATIYYSILPSGIARTNYIPGRSLLLGTDGKVFPLKITDNKKVCEYNFSITGIGSIENESLNNGRFETCFPELSTSFLCSFDIDNEIIKPISNNINGIQFFYRPINLNIVFPNSKGKTSLNYSRTIGSNWNNEKGKETIAEIESNNDKIYANYGDGGNGPEYSYTITPLQAWHIRDYNQEEESIGLGYADFNLICDEYGKQCRSKWLDGIMGTCEGRVNCGDYYFTDNLTSTPNDLSTRNVYFCGWQDGTSWKGNTANELCKYDEIDN